MFAEHPNVLNALSGLPEDIGGLIEQYSQVTVVKSKNKQSDVVVIKRSDFQRLSNLSDEVLELVAPCVYLN